ncbi:MAG: SIMPL domain-containing protein [Geitlerinemataceae cyanobacterium]
MLFRALALTGVTLLSTIAPSFAAPTAPGSEPLVLANGHDGTTIAVSVSDAATASVDRVQMKYGFYDGGFYNYDAGQYEKPPSLNIAAIESAVLPALNRAGISASSVEFAESPVGLYGGGEVSIVITLPASHTAIGNANDAMSDAASQFSDITMQTFGVRLGSNGCEAIGREARENALALAQERAGILADSMGMTLGEVMSIHETYQDMIPYGSATCLEPSGEFPPIRLASYGGEWTMYNSSAPLEVEMTTSIEVMFAAE